jgi:hypothetical protein
MAVSVQNPYKIHTGNGVATLFAFDFKVLLEDDLYVTVDGVEVTSYTVSGLGLASGGDITFTTAPASGAVIVIERRIALARLTDYQYLGDFRSDVVNPDFDRLWMAAQQLQALLDRTPMLPIASAIRNMVFPEPVAGYYLRVQNDGTLAFVSDIADPGVYIAGYTGAVSRSAADRLSERVHCKDFSSSVEAGFALACSAVRAAGGGQFGTGHVQVTISAPLKLTGEFNDGIYFDGGRSRFTMGFNGDAAVIVNNEVGSIASAYFNKAWIGNLNVAGPGKTGGNSGLKIQAASNVFVEKYRAYNCHYALHLDGGLSCEIRDSILQNSAVGVYANFFDDGLGGLNSFGPNAVSFYGTRIYGCDKAIDYTYNPSGAVNWIGCNFEGNNSSGSAADGKKVIEMTNAGHHNFIGVHAESNKGQYCFHFTGFDAGKSLLILGSEIIPECDTVVHVAQGRFTGIASRITNGTATNDTYIAAGARATLIDVEGNASGDLSYMIGMRDGHIAYGKQPVIGDPLLNMLSDPIAAASNIATNFRNDTVQARVQNTAGTRISYTQWSNAGDTVMHNDHAYGWRFDVSNTNRFYIGRSGALSIEPATNNNISNGSASLLWSVVYAGTTSISTSDARLKTAPEDIPDAWLDAWADVQYYRFKFLDAVAQKGDGARWHLGVIAQRVKAAFEAHGLDPFAIGVLCFDKWEDQFENVSAEYEAVPARYEMREAYIDDQLVFHPAEEVEVEPARTVLVREAYQQKVVSAGDRYGVRYDEAHVFEAALQRREVARLNAQVQQLAADVAQLKAA